MSRTSHAARIHELNTVSRLLHNGLRVALRESNGQVNGLRRAIQIVGERKREVKEGEADVQKGN